MSFSSIEKESNNKQYVSSKLFEVKSLTRKYGNNSPTNSSSLVKHMLNTNDVDSKQEQCLKVISTKSYDYTPVLMAKEMFYDFYSMSTINLSTIVQPECLKDTAFLKAPEAYNEINRLSAVDRYMDLPHWEKSKRFLLLLKSMKDMFNVSGAAISLIDSRSQICKFEYGYGFKDCTRQISIDSHAILSNDYFVLLDASKDWRFKSNPLVKDIPTIKYYLGVPLVTKSNQVIGILSVFDRHARSKVNKVAINVLQKVSNEIMQYLDSSYKPTKNCISTRKSQILQHTGSTAPWSAKYDQDDSNQKRLFALYGRATRGSHCSNGSIFERDGSGSSYIHSSKFKLTKYSSPYEDLIDFQIWNELSRCPSFSKACLKLCNILQKKMNYDCVYILNIKVTKICWIKTELFPKTQRTVDITEFQHWDEIEWEKNEDNIEDDFDYSKTNINAISCNNKSIERTLKSSPWGYRFHKQVIQSMYGLEYHNTDKDVVYHAGYSLPFYKYGNRLIRKQKNMDVKEAKTMELFFKRNGYLITCLSKNGRLISDLEKGHVYGCASLLRKIFFC